MRKGRGHGQDEGRGATRRDKVDEAKTNGKIGGAKYCVVRRVGYKMVQRERGERGEMARECSNGGAGTTKQDAVGAGAR
jgi:hypothetical protein